MEEARKAIGYDYKDAELLRQALTHRSYANEHNTLDNERFEFLGDSVLSIIISDYIFKRMKNRTEGDLSKFRAAIVCEQSLAEVSEKIQLSKYIRLGKGEEMTGGRERPSIVSDAFEAIIASIYLDGGIEVARKWVLDNMMDQIDAVLAGKKLKDYKTTLQEKVQKGHTGKVTYETVGESGEDHSKMFEVNVMIDGVVIASGTGRSKKDAEQQSAKEALEKLG